jgi:hypothetical protein
MARHYHRAAICLIFHCRFDSPSNLQSVPHLDEKRNRCTLRNRLDLHSARMSRAISNSFEEKFHLRRPFPDWPSNSFVSHCCRHHHLFTSSQFKSASGRVRHSAETYVNTLLVNRVHQSERFLVRQNRLLHLVHDVTETNLAFRISEGMAATGSGMTE